MVASASGLQQHRVPNRLRWEVEALVASALALLEFDARRSLGEPPRTAPLDEVALLAQFGSAIEEDGLTAMIELESVSSA